MIRRRVIPALLAALTLSMAMAIAPTARADEGVASTRDARGVPWSVRVAPRYFATDRDRYNSAFVGNGFDPARSGMIGIEFTAYATTENDLQIGVTVGSAAHNREYGSNVAELGEDFVSLYLAKDFVLSPHWDISAGANLGFGQARLEVLSPVQNGREDESAFLIEPTVIAAYRVIPWLKVGASLAYLQPVAQSMKIKGEDLGTGKISLHGWSAGLEFIFGQ